jgi:hypothetical protein
LETTCPICRNSIDHKIIKKLIKSDTISIEDFSCLKGVLCRSERDYYNLSVSNDNEWIDKIDSIITIESITTKNIEKKYLKLDDKSIIFETNTIQAFYKHEETSYSSDIFLIHNTDNDVNDFDVFTKLDNIFINRFDTDNNYYKHMIKEIGDRKFIVCKINSRTEKHPNGLNLQSLKHNSKYRCRFIFEIVFIKIHDTIYPTINILSTKCLSISTPPKIINTYEFINE